MKILLSQLLLLVATQAASAQEMNEEQSLRLLPEERIRPNEQRSLYLLRTDFLRSVIEMEMKALDREEAQLAGGTSGDDRFQRVSRDRVLIGQMLEQTRFDLDPSRISKTNLPLFDRYLYLFARTKLVHEGLDLSKLEAWHSANVDYMETGDSRHRELAIAGRNAAFIAMKSTTLLRNLIVKIGKGPLSEDDRKRFVDLLRQQYPDLQLSATSMLTLPSFARGAAPPQTGLPEDTSLPRLDGIEHPGAVLESVRQLPALLKSGAGKQ